MSTQEISEIAEIRFGVFSADEIKKIRANAYQWGQRKGVKISTRHFEGIGLRIGRLA